MSLYEKSVYLTLVFAARKLRNFTKPSKDEAMIDAHGRYIVTCRGMSYPYVLSLYNIGIEHMV